MYTRNITTAFPNIHLIPLFQSWKYGLCLGSCQDVKIFQLIFRFRSCVAKSSIILSLYCGIQLIFVPITFTFNESVNWYIVFHSKKF